MGIGFSEIILIALVIIVFIRPNDLPKFLRTAGKYYGKAKKLYKEITEMKDKLIKEIDEAATLDEPAGTSSKDAPSSPPKSLPQGETKPSPETAPENPPSTGKEEVSH